MCKRDIYCLLTGLAIVHPLFDRPSSVNSQMLFTSVAHFENYAGFTDILQHMLRFVLIIWYGIVGFNVPLNIL